MFDYREDQARLIESMADASKRRRSEMMWRLADRGLRALCYAVIVAMFGIAFFGY